MKNLLKLGFKTKSFFYELKYNVFREVTHYLRSTCFVVFTYVVILCLTGIFCYDHHSMG